MRKLRKDVTTSHYKKKCDYDIVSVFFLVTIDKAGLNSYCKVDHIWKSTHIRDIGMQLIISHYSKHYDLNFLQKGRVKRFVGRSNY